MTSFTGDVFDWLARLGRRSDLFDLVILRSAGFSRTKHRSFNAAHDYSGLAEMAARVAARDALLLACCNVAELPWRAFRERVLAGLAEAGRTAQNRRRLSRAGDRSPVAMGWGAVLEDACREAEIDPYRPGLPRAPSER